MDKIILVTIFLKISFYFLLSSSCLLISNFIIKSGQSFARIVVISIPLIIITRFIYLNRLILSLNHFVLVMIACVVITTILLKIALETSLFKAGGISIIYFLLIAGFFGGAYLITIFIAKSLIEFCSIFGRFLGHII